MLVHSGAPQHTRAPEVSDGSLGDRFGRPRGKPQRPGSRSRTMQRLRRPLVSALHAAEHDALDEQSLRPEVQGDAGYGDQHRHPHEELGRHR